MYRKLITFLNIFKINSEEKIFLANNKLNSFYKKKKKKILVQISDKYYNLLLIKFIKLKKYSNEEFIGIYTHCICTYNKFYFFSWIIYLIKNKIYNLLLFHKWSKLYTAIGVSLIYNINFYKKNFILRSKADIIFKNIKEKKSILSIKYRGIKVGDLIYDTYIRYKKNPTVDIKDYYLRFLIAKSITCIDFCYSNLKKKNIKKYYTSYSSYINHGIVVRYFIKIGVQVVSSGSRFSIFKILKKNDTKHLPNFKIFNREFQKLNSKNNKILLCQKLLKKKFLGKKEISSKYLDNISYKNKNINDEKIKIVDGIIFLHDFFDACHDFDGLLFNDFYEWTIFSLDLIRKYKLKIGIKPHPNNIYESKKVIIELKRRYNDLIWIDAELSNYKILKSKNIKFGISAVGSILYELAYFSKIGISAGYSPTISFSISQNPKNIFEYQNLLINSNKINNRYKISHNEDVCKIYYMYFLNDLLKSRVFFYGINLLEMFDTNNPKQLLYYNKKINEELYN